MLTQELRRQGITVNDASDLVSGTSFVRQIKEATEASRAIVVLVSNTSPSGALSDQELMEIRSRAIHGVGLVIPVLIAPAGWGDAHVSLRTFQGAILDESKNVESVARRIAEALLKEREFPAKDQEMAANRLESAFAANLQQYGAHHPDTDSSRSALANVYLQMGRLEDAIPLLELSLAHAGGDASASRTDTLATRNNLAGAYRSLGDLGRAIALYEQTLADSERVLGSEHPNTLATRNNLAGAYAAIADLGRAIPLYEQTLADRERVLGSDHPDTLASRNNLAGAYLSSGDLGRAIPLYEQTLADSERVLGSDHPNTLATRNNLAGAYMAIGDRERAIALYEQTLARATRVFGLHHAETRRIVLPLAEGYRSVGRVGEAISLLDSVLSDLPTPSLSGRIIDELVALRDSLGGAR